jgi:hypothetical protein
VKDGLNCPPAHPEAILKLSEGSAGTPLLYDVNWLLVVYVPHPAGVANAARGPPKKFSFTSENGS